MTELAISDFESMDKVFRLNLVNCIGGFKSANLLGTRSRSGQENLAIFSSVTHIGSNPPLLGFITRPTTVPRHTYRNIKETGHFTINHIHHSFTQQAHHTSAKFDAHISEFDVCGFTPEYKNNFQAPFVLESHVQLGMSFVEEHPIPANNTILVIGRIEHIYVPENSIAEDGWLDLNAVGTTTISGLNGYHKAEQIHRYDYARASEPIKVLS